MTYNVFGGTLNLAQFNSSFLVNAILNYTLITSFIIIHYY